MRPLTQTAESLTARNPVRFEREFVQPYHDGKLLIKLVFNRMSDRGKVFALITIAGWWRLEVISCMQEFFGLAYAPGMVLRLVEVMQYRAQDQRVHRLQI